MRESNAQKNMPMAAPDEAKTEAPGLRVGEGAWKWPPVWPYDGNFFKRKVELENSKQKNNPLSNPMSMMTGAGGGGMMDGIGKEGDNSTTTSGVEFDSIQYWNENENVKTELDPRVAEKITK